MRKGLFVFMLMALVLVVMACSGGESEEVADQGAAEPVEETSETEADAGEPVQGGTLVITDLSDAQSLDPHRVTTAASMRYIENMYSTLLRYTEGAYGELEGDLAESYDVSEDGLTYTFTLRDGVTFHDGKPLTSEDVKYSIERIVEQEVRAPQFSAVESIETPDDLTVVIQLSEPVSPFLTFLAYPMNAIVNQDVVEANNGSLDQVDAGSGPFQLVERKPDQHTILERFEDYFVEGKPYLDRVEWRAIPDETARLTAIRNGEIDVILQVAPKDVALLEADDSILLESVTGTFWEYMGLNTSEGPLADKKVRQAISWAIDRQEINDVVKFGEATVLENGPIPPGHWAHDETAIYPNQDLEKAQELLNEAGYPDGFSISLKVNSTSGEQVDAAQMIRQQLQAINIDVDVQTQESSIFFDGLGKQDFEMSVVGWVGFVDPDEFLYNIFHTGEVWNQQAYSNPEVDALLEEGRLVVDEAERKAIYAEAQQLIAEDAPMVLVFLYANAQTSAMNEKVRGFDVHPTVTTLSLRDTWLAE